jgi:hypothetical protein
VRRLWLALIALGILVFLALSALLARVFSVDGAERSAITALVQDEARGDVSAVSSRLLGCPASAACRARAAHNAAALKRPGKVSILQIQPSAGFSLTSTLGTARVAWNVGSSLPIVQCVRVRRAGNALSGLRVELLAITPRIKSDQDCPARF